MICTDLRAPGVAWVALTGLLAAGSALALWLPAAAIDWQPGLAAREPWRTVSAAWVHWSGPHLGANLLAAAVVAAYGWAARAPLAWALAWCVAWPLTQAGLWLQPALAHYGGASGVLHAGVAVASLGLLVARRGRPRIVGGLVLLGLLIKVVLEEPWGAPLQHSAAFDIALAPLAHASGAVSGLLCGGVALAFGRGDAA